MAMKLLAAAAAALLLVGCINLASALDGAALIHVAGKVMCQDCTKGYNEWVNGDRPIKGSRVSLTCMDERRRVMYYNSDETDVLGQYDMTVNRYINGKELNEKMCTVRLVSSPDSACNILTDFGGGKSGVKLTQPSFIYRDLIKYVVGPFYFTSPMCDQPDTSDFAHQSHGTNY